MGTIELHHDFNEFLRLLNANGVRYLLVGGHAVGFHGYPRATGDMVVWVAAEPVNVERLVQAVQEFGLPADDTTKEALLQRNRIIRMGYPPVRIELLTDISGVDFEECYGQRTTAESDGIPVSIISLPMLKANKKAAGRLKDLEDLRHLP